MIPPEVRLRRRRYFVLRVADKIELNLARFIRATYEGVSDASCTLLCPVRGKPIAISPADLELVLKVPQRSWILLSEVKGLDQIGRARLWDLARRGLLLSDPATEGWEDLAAGEQALADVHWHDLAVVYHTQTQWQGVDTLKYSSPIGSIRLTFDHLTWMRGAAPSHFEQRSDALQRIPLDVPKWDDHFFDVLLARRTSRAYRSEQSLPLGALESVLYAVFGTHGTLELSEGLTAVKRTSPSGGALHPIEAYLLLIRVEGVSPGLYHYEGRTHALEQLEAMDVDTACQLACDFTAGQTFFAEAHALVIHVARFHRNFWKYGQDAKAYKTVYMDSGHLSQTFYLTATHLGLGAFYTAAINDVDIGRRLGLHAFRESAIGINGLGIVDHDRDDLHFLTDPYQPVSIEVEPG